MPWTEEQDARVREALEDAYRSGRSTGIEGLRVFAKRIAGETGLSETECLSRMRQLAPVIWAEMKQDRHPDPGPSAHVTKQTRPEYDQSEKESIAVVDRRIASDEVSSRPNSETDEKVESDTPNQSSKPSPVRTLVLAGGVLSVIILIIVVSTIGKNRPPEPYIQIPNATVVEGKEVKHSIGTAFRDDDDGELNYEAEPAEDGIVVVQVLPPELLIRAVRVGKTSVRVTAIDRRGLRSAQTFHVEVIGNRPPIVKSSIDDIEIENGQYAVVDLSIYFRDPDNDELRYETVTDTAGVVVLEVSPPNMAIRSVAAGKASVRITAVDPSGLSSSQSFAVEVSAPPPLVLAQSVDDVVAGLLSRFFGPIDRSTSPIVTIDTTSAASVDGQIRIVLDRGSLLQAEFDLRLPPVSRVGRDSYEEYHRLTRVYLANFVDNVVLEIDGSDAGLRVVDTLMAGIAEKIRSGSQDRDAFGPTGYYSAGLATGGAHVLLKFSMAGAANPSMDYYVLYISEHD